MVPMKGKNHNLSSVLGNTFTDTQTQDRQRDRREWDRMRHEGQNETRGTEWDTRHRMRSDETRGTEWDVMRHKRQNETWWDTRDNLRHEGQNKTHNSRDMFEVGFFFFTTKAPYHPFKLMMSSLLFSLWVRHVTVVHRLNSLSYIKCQETHYCDQAHWPRSVRRIWAEWSGGLLHRQSCWQQHGSDQFA